MKARRAERKMRNDYGDDPGGAGMGIVLLVAFGVIAVAIIAIGAWIFS
jgi:hypothetical protein